MPQNDADRIARQRAQHQKDQAAVAQRGAEAARQSLIQQIEAEIPITLRWLADHDYPRVVDVSFRSE